VFGTVLAHFIATDFVDGIEPWVGAVVSGFLFDLAHRSSAAPNHTRSTS
jgi:hypothetical protein